jgi:hypothetical protein
MHSALRKLILSTVIAAAGLGGTVAAAPAALAVPPAVVAAASAASTAPAVSAAPAAVITSLTPHPAIALTAAKVASKKVLKHTVFKQNLPYNCGPSATLIVLSTWGIKAKTLGFKSNSAFTKWIGKQEHTTSSGTNSIHDVVRGLSAAIKKHGKGGEKFYTATMIKGFTASKSDVSKLKKNIVTDINYFDHGIVANVVGTAYDTSGVRHRYSGGHYLAVVGYKDGGNTARISDNATGREYWMKTSRLATWIGSKGYAH